VIDGFDLATCPDCGGRDVAVHRRSDMPGVWSLRCASCASTETDLEEGLIEVRGRVGLLESKINLLLSRLQFAGTDQRRFPPPNRTLKQGQRP
jgi:hypothetical protein